MAADRLLVRLMQRYPTLEVEQLDVFAADLPAFAHALDQVLAGHFIVDAERGRERAPDQDDLVVEEADEVERRLKSVREALAEDPETDAIVTLND